MDVHTRDLRYFVTVAQERHVTRAAARLHVSQPALSKQLRALERQVDAVLLRRLPHGVELTPAGEALLPHARALLERADDAARDVAAASRRLVVGVSTGVGRGLLPAVRSRVATQEPGLDPRVRTVPWDDATAGLADGSSDVAVAWAPVPGRVRTLVLAREPVAVALPPGHALAGRTSVAFADLLDEPFLALPAEVRSMEETHEALLDGRGVVLLAAGNADALTREGVAVVVVDDLPPATLVLAWRADDRRPAVRAYVDACREVLAARG